MVVQEHRDVVETSDTGDLDHGKPEASADIGHARRCLAAMQLDEVGTCSIDRCRDGSIIGINDKDHPFKRWGRDGGKRTRLPA